MCFANPTDVIFREFTALFAEIPAQRSKPLRCVDKLNLALPVLRLPIGQHPDVSGYTGVVEHVRRQRDDGLQPIVGDNPPANVTLALASITCEKGRGVVYLRDAASECCLAVKLRGHID